MTDVSTDLEPPENEPEEQPGTVDQAELRSQLTSAARAANDVSRIAYERTVDVNPDLDEDAFFTSVDGESTVVTRYDLERAVPQSRKSHFREVDRYWVNKPYAFAIIFHSERENEPKYYIVEPHLSPVEADIKTFLTEKLTNSIKYSWDTGADDSPGARARVIERETYDLLTRYDIYTPRRDGRDGSAFSVLGRWFGLNGKSEATAQNLSAGSEGPGQYIYPSMETLGQLEGAATRPEHAVLPEGETRLTEYQVEKLLYYLRRDFVGYERIDPVKHDVNVEDISCDGYNSPVFVYHTDYEQLITNIEHGEADLDDFVVKLAQRSGKSISKRQPQIDATLPDGSRAQLTLGHEVSDRGTNYTIRQFTDVPFTPVDLVNWNTFSLDQIALLWLCIENNKSILFAGGTASGKTTSLNALSLFIPSTAKIVSIEDTREVELPQRNWVASVTRPSFATDERGDVDEFDLLEAALRQRPDYIVMGEVRGEEGRTLFQMMSTGHTTYTTFHADTVGEVIDRFTTEPIHVSKSLFTALDLISVQTQTQVQGRKVRRNRTLTEINRYDAELDEVNVQDIYQWQPAADTFRQRVEPNVLEEIKFDRGWDDARLEEELFKRQVVVAYLVNQNMNSYAEVAAAVQGFISDPETILALVAQDRLGETLSDLRSMESVDIDIRPEKEEMVPRPDPGNAALRAAGDVLKTAEADLFDAYEDRSVTVDDLESSLSGALPFDWNTGASENDEIEAEPSPAQGVANGGRPEEDREGSS